MTGRPALVVRLVLAASLIVVILVATWSLTGSPDDESSCADAGDGCGDTASASGTMGEERGASTIVATHTTDTVTRASPGERETTPTSNTRPPATPVGTSPPDAAAAPSGCVLAEAAFCEDFEGERGSSAGRNGDVSLERFSLARWRSELKPDVNQVGPGSIGECRDGASRTPLPPADSLICDPSSGIASHHLLVSTAEQNYGDNLYRINQPFDVAGRTGTFAFDVSLAIDGLLVGFPIVVFTEEPMSAPSYLADNSGGATPHRGLAVHFKSVCAAEGAWSPHAAVMVYDQHDEQLLEDGAGCPAFVTFRPGRLNRVEIRLSETAIEVWASDHSSDGVTFGPLQLMYSSALTLPMTRGFLYFGVHNHASEKYTPGTPSVNAVWDNLAFDGPIVPVTRVSQVADSGVPANGGSSLGYELPSSGWTPALALPDVVPGDQARLLFNSSIDCFNNSNPETWRVRYRLNGGAEHAVGFTAAELARALGRSCSYSWTIPVDVGELVSGTNTIELSGEGFAAGYQAVIANIDLVTWNDSR